jgi:hypothetical protein
MPTLGGVPLTYSHELRGELLFNLCAALTREGLGTPAIWKKCDGSCVTFAEQAILSAIGKETWDLLRRHSEYHLSVSNVGTRDGDDAPMGEGLLAVTIECSSYAYLKIGPVIVALEQEMEGLGAAFYWGLLHALYRTMRIYDHEDAMRYEEMMRESAEQDADNQDQYEFPEVEKAMPPCVRNSWNGNFGANVRQSSRLLSLARNGKYRSWIDRLRNIQRLARLALRTDREFIEQGGYDGPPLPSLLVTFEPNDAVMACFDEEAQSMMEYSSEPTFAVVVAPDDPGQVKRAVRMVGRFIALNRELFLLVEEIEEWEKRDEGSHLDRGEPSLRAA